MYRISYIYMCEYRGFMYLGTEVVFLFVKYDSNTVFISEFSGLSVSSSVFLMAVGMNLSVNNLGDNVIK